MRRLSTGHVPELPRLRYESFGVGVFTVRDGRIAAVREYMGTGYARRTAFAPGR
jgi:ketosteroid isomerase-like protein